MDVATGEPATAINQRSDVCAVPAAAVVAEAMVALVLAEAATGEVRRRLGRRDAPQRRRLPRQPGDPMTGRPRSRVRAVGPPGAGKTTVGQAASPSALGVAFRDTDADIEATAGKPIPDIFVDDGEDAFRALERAAVAAALESFDGVLALGGGAVLADETRGPLPGTPWCTCAWSCPTR